jgi:hypothetical protein
MLISEDSFTRDRRSVIGSDLFGRAAHVANLETIAELGAHNVVYEPLAVRGSTLAVGRLSIDFAEWDSRLLALSELDADGLVASAVYFDEEALADALAELDERYIAGEGAEHAQLLRAAFDIDRAFRSDQDAAAARFAPDFVFDDHRRLFYGKGGLAHLTAARRASDETGLDVAATVNRKVLVAGRTILTVQHAMRRSSDGRDFEWNASLIAVFDPSFRLRRLEYFDDDDWDAALARFDELAAQATPTSPEIENTATRLNALWVEAKNAGRSADLEHLIAPSYIVVSHRFGGIVPTSEGVDQLRALSSAGDEVGFSAQTIEPVALRGDRLALVQLTATTADGYISERLEVTEIDEQARFTRTEIFDVDDLARAVALLDDWYIAGEGRPDAAVIEALAQTTVASNAKDWARFPSLYNPDFTFVDHTTIGWPELDLDGYIAIQQSYVDQVHVRSLIRWVRVRGRTALGTSLSDGTDPDGGTFEWVFHGVSHFDAAHRLLRTEVYADHDFDAALASFEELAAAVAEPTVTTADSHAGSNRAARCAHAYDAAFAAQDWDRIAASYHDDVLNDDRRTAVSSGVTIGRDGLLELVRGLVDVGFTTVTQTPIAVRGEALAVVRRTFEAESGSCLELVAVIEYDEQDRMTANVMFDLDDRAAALEELEDRYCACEGATDAYLIRRAGDLVRSMAAPDGAATLDLVHPDARFTDHRRLGLGTMGFDGVRGILAARAEQIAEDTSYFADLAARDSTTMGLLVSAGTGPDGTEVLYEFHSVIRWCAGKMLDIDWFDPSDRDAARACFEELAAADPRTPNVDNAVVRKLVAGTWKQVFDPTHDPHAEFGAQNAADVVVVDRRRGVSIGVLHGHDEMQQNMRAQDDLFGPTTFEPIAVRGERLALARTRAIAPSGFELVSLGIVEIDADGRYCSWTFFDDTDLVAALETLEQRHRELSGDAYPPNEQLFVERSIAYQHGDLDTMLGSSGADYQVVDHTPVGFGAADAAGLRAQIDAQSAQIPTVAIQAKRYVSERAILEATSNRGTTQDGHDYAWAYATVACFDRDGRIAADHAFPIEHWDEARALFDEWTAAG